MIDLLITQVQSFVFLGVCVDQHLSWKEHISNISSKINTRISKLLLGLLKHKMRVSSSENPNMYIPSFLRNYFIIYARPCRPMLVEMLMDETDDSNDSEEYLPPSLKRKREKFQLQQAKRISTETHGTSKLQQKSKNLSVTRIHLAKTSRNE